MKSAIALLPVVLSLVACSASSGGASNSNSTGSGSGAAAGSGSGGAPPVLGTGGSNVGGLDIGAVGGSGGMSDVMNGECNQMNFVSSRKPASVLLVLDRSRSMIENNIPSGATRWDAIRDALGPAILGTDATIQWGYKVYPGGDENTPEEATCTEATVITDISLPVMAGNGVAVEEAVRAEGAWGHGTPTGHAIAGAASYLATLGDDTQKFILLATDGVPSCDGTPSENSEGARTYAVEQIQAAYSAGFPTFVIGVLGGSDSNLQTLNNMGIAGGRPPAGSQNPLANKFYHAESAEALVASLNTITSEVASCVFAFDAPPPDPTNIAVKINDVRVDQDAGNGWEYTSDAHMGVEVHGTTCEQVRAAQLSEIDIIFGCKGQPIL